MAPGDSKDLYIATFNEEAGQWNMPVNMGIPVNAAPATDVDPLRLGDDREPTTTPRLVPYPISTDEGNEHCPMLLQDGETLCFASSREGGYGGSDIWCSQEDADGNWSGPEPRKVASRPPLGGGIGSAQS